MDRVTYLEKENRDLAKALKKAVEENKNLKNENGGMRMLGNEMMRLASYVIEMNCGGKLTVSNDTFLMFMRSKAFELEVSGDEQGNRTYTVTRKQKLNIVQGGKQDAGA